MVSTICVCWWIRGGGKETWIFWQPPIEDNVECHSEYFSVLKEGLNFIWWWCRRRMENITHNITSFAKQTNIMDHSTCSTNTRICTDKNKGVKVWMNVFIIPRWWQTLWCFSPALPAEYFWQLPDITCLNVNLSKTKYLDNNCPEIVFFVFRWFEELGPICDLLEKAREIGVSQIKSPVGRVFQKYVYTYLIYSQNEDQCWIFWALLVQFRLGIVCQEGFQELWIFEFFRAKSSNLEKWKIWGMDIEMALYLRKYKNLVNEVY